MLPNILLHVHIQCPGTVRVNSATGHTGRRECGLSGMRSQNWGLWKHNTSGMHLSPPPLAELPAHWLTWCYQSLSHLVPLLVVITPCNGASCQRVSNAAGPLSLWLSICRGSRERSARTVAQREKQPDNCSECCPFGRWCFAHCCRCKNNFFLIVQIRTLAWV